MNNDVFGYLLNDSLAEKERIFKLSKAILNENEELVIVLLVDSDDYDKYLDDELRNKVKAIVAGIVPDGIITHVVYRKTETTDKYVIQLIYDYFYNESTLILNKLKNAKIDVEIDFGTLRVKIGITPDMYGYLCECGYADKLAKYVSEFVMEEVEIEFYRVAGETRQIEFKKVRGTSTVRPSLRTVDVRVTVPIVGEIARKPLYIVDIAKKEWDTVTVCGKVEDVKEMKSKAGKTFFKARINDTTGAITILYFPRFPKQEEAMRSYLIPNVEVVVDGELKMDERSASYVLFVRKFAQCNIDHASINTEIVYNEVAEYYNVVLPQKYEGEEDLEQAKIFDVEQELPEMLKGRLVVFDLETTGLSATNCKIIEIGAVSLEDGVLKETFSTLIDPKEHIPDDASQTNHIYDEDVAGCPEFKDVVADFHKFCHGATLVAHNASFDIGFLTYHAKQELYNFDNPVIDTLDLAKKVLKRDRRNTLSDLCKEFDIELLNAHRALFDTIATAKVLKKLAYLSEKRY
ncbi:MAG: 3'-5' exoribonuclease [Clostridia bacterium]|nr:3'-5' exoribonuclease [Clostridia bacterium]